jgi:heme-degrading monooxygenase HmoA
VQEKGRFEVFQDYHLRVGEVAADTRIPAGQSLREQRFDATEVGAAKVVSIVELDPGPGAMPSSAATLHVPEVGRDGVRDAEVYESITTPGKQLMLVSWRDADAADAWRLPDAGQIRHRRVRVIRDYGMADRREAPQFYPDVARRGEHG